MAADLPRVRLGRPRRRIVLASIAGVLIVAVVLIRLLSGLYVSSLWFSSIHQHEVFSTMLETKLGLFFTFGLVFFLAMWGNLLLCNRLGPSEVFLDAPEDELVRRFQGAVRPYAGRLYALLAFVLALIAASTAVGNWQSYLLFANAKSFGVTDPLFHKDVGFYVFQLPFLTFVVDWFLGSLLVVIIFTVIFHYLNGGIRAARVSPRVSPAVKVHLSVLLALLALAKAAGYLVARWHMVTSASAGDGILGGGYTDVHWRLPALMILFWWCLAAAVILLINIRQRGWTLPVIAVGLWAFVALVIGVIIPVIVQAVKVTPAQSTLELPYIKDNIAATRAAYDLQDVTTTRYVPTSSKPDLRAPGIPASLADIRQWDPEIGLATFQTSQDKQNYYTIAGSGPLSALGEDRYTIDGKVTPVVIGVRELSTTGIPNPSWVNTHLEYTHGIGVVAAPSNVTLQGGRPDFTESDVPPATSGGFPSITHNDIYFGLNQGGFVVVDTKQRELDYQSGNGALRESAYSGGGGVAMGGFFRRMMMAVHFGDLNLLTSNLITSNSRIMFVRDPVQIAQQAAPFLSIDDHPYAVIADGHVDWILDGYTTTDQYPYSQNADTQLVPADNGLPSSYNYVRNSVKVVVDAYTGKVTFYAMPPTGDPPKPDPILEAWESIFPGLIEPYADMPTVLRDHLRYPEDIFSIQSAIWGRYHLPLSTFYSNGDGWSISPTDGAGPPNSTISTNTTTNSRGDVVSTTYARMDPLYEVYSLPGSSSPQFTLTEAYVAASSASTASATATNAPVLPLKAFIVALSDTSDYGQLRVYEPPASANIPGPVFADSQMNSNDQISPKETLFNQHGSQALLGSVLMIPIDGEILYVRPFYVTSTAYNLPLLRYYLADFNGTVEISTSLKSAVDGALGASTAPSTGPVTHRQTVKQLLSEALQYAKLAKQSLPNLQLWGKYTDEENALILRAATQAGSGTAQKATTHHKS